MNFVGFCLGGFLRGGERTPQAILQFPDFGSSFADEKQNKKTLKKGHVLRRCLCRCLHLVFYLLKALFYIPCNTDGNNAGLIGSIFLQLPYSAFPFI